MWQFAVSRGQATKHDVAPLSSSHLLSSSLSSLKPLSKLLDFLLRKLRGSSDIGHFTQKVTLAAWQDSRDYSDMLFWPPIPTKAVSYCLEEQRRRGRKRFQVYVTLWERDESIDLDEHTREICHNLSNFEENWAHMVPLRVWTWPFELHWSFWLPGTSLIIQSQLLDWVPNVESPENLMNCRFGPFFWFSYSTILARCCMN